MTYLKSFILDAWAGLSHNAALGEGDLPSTGPDLAPSWVGRKHHRRLQAYKLLAAYRKNVARHHLHFEDRDAQLKHREYGDPELLVQQVRASLLGGTPKPAVDGAGGRLRAEPTEEDAEADGRPLETLRSEWNEEKAARSGAVERQRWFERQYKAERAAMKIIGCENNVVGLGDAVWVLSWSQEARRVRVRHYDPGFYFPTDPDGDDEYPNRIHLAWEEEREKGDGSFETYVRRITYERRQVAEWTPPYSSEQSLWRVFLTDATWRQRDLRAPRGVDHFDLSHAVYGRNDQGQQLNDYDLGIDFIPVVHVPNTIPESEGEPWGESILTRVAQLFDDLARADTDLSVTTDLLGSPPIAIDGAVAAPVDRNGDPVTVRYEPGEVLGGKVTVVDTSKSLDALLKRTDALFERLSVNRQVPQSVLGRVNLDNGRLAGITLMLSFGPFKTLIGDMRLVREDKYRLLHKMWQRLAIVGGTYEPNREAPGALPADAKVLDVDMAFGPYLPTDLDGVKQLVIDLILNNVISKATGLRLMVEAGLDVDDLETEIKRARAEDFAGAETLANATGSEKAAIDHLGLDIEPPEPAPAPAAPGGPPAAPEPPAAPRGETRPGERPNT